MATRNRRAKPADQRVNTKTYILDLKNGNTRRITIPSSWKMTFGSILPRQEGSGGGYRNTEAGFCLRLYEGNKENLRAVMTDVAAIRDASISMMEKRTTVKRQAAQKQTAKGMKDVVVEARMTEWVNPDAEEEGDVPNEFLRLPGSDTPDDELTF